VVTLHRPPLPQPVVSRSARRHHHPGEARCVVCGAALGSDHCDDLVCSSHMRTGFNPRQVSPQELDERVALLLLRAAGRPLVLCRALGCEESDTNRSAVRDSVRRLNASGFLNIVACGRKGRKLARQWRLGRRKIQTSGTVTHRYVDP